jgi:hypothetical protein
VDSLGVETAVTAVRVETAQANVDSGMQVVIKDNVVKFP